jgi:GNAT superfamily N-acetyltransferase
MNITKNSTQLFGSTECARRIEAMQAQNQCDYASTYAQQGRSGICEAIRVGKYAAALFAGTESPLTQSFGLGFDEHDAQEIEHLEDFFFSHGVAVNVELANTSSLDFTLLLGQRHYSVSEYSHVLGYALHRLSHQSLHDTLPFEVYRVLDTDADAAGKVISAGFLEQNLGEQEIPPAFLELFSVSFRTQGSSIFAVNIGGEIAGVGGITILDGIALLSGASTQPKFRNQGVQNALIEARLRYAHEQGCELAVVSTAPGTVSQKNMQKIGFEILYARTKFTRQKP